MLKIVATFKNSFGKNQIWSFNDPDTNKTDTEIKGLLERMTGVKLCQKDGAELFHTVETAKYVETIERIIF
ncbi:hypothetical protein [Enterococcus sp.]|uniref:DUF2922 family protein n=1 Tax=Enterococcus sp. TaxID=35783 RepID=UPI0029072F38|nr:hypothetical protein [Enterococcus sp.]MDU5334908.1 hypothetical protein [Enterococcus sp.]